MLHYHNVLEVNYGHIIQYIMAMYLYYGDAICHIIVMYLCYGDVICYSNVITKERHSGDIDGIST